jgi:hypothetical protein
MHNVCKSSRPKRQSAHRRMRWVRDDGGSPCYARRRRDCVIRAIAIATGKPYREVRLELTAATLHYVKTHRNRVVGWIKNSRRGRGFNPVNGSFDKVYRPYLESLGWQWTATASRVRGYRHSNVPLRADDLPSGRLIVQVNRHLVAVIDGAIHDTFDSGGAGRRPVYGFYTLKAMA